MSTIEDFENAPVGATATHADGGSRAMKMGDAEQRWILPIGIHLTDEGMEHWGYTLDPLPSQPTSAREALDLAWELAHPVREGQQIPSDMVCLQDEGDRITMIITPKNWTPTFPESIRTLDPLPDPKPDWLDAPAVLARHVKHAPDSSPHLWVNLGDGMWGHAETTKRAETWDLCDVTALYPKGQGK